MSTARSNRPEMAIDRIKALKPEGIILSGGPASIYEGSPRTDKGILALGIPILGICYGLQFMVDALGGRGGPPKKREYGFAELIFRRAGGLFTGVASHPLLDEPWRSDR